MNVSARKQEISRRREDLVARNDSYRYQIADAFQQLQPRIDYVEAVVRFVNSVRANVAILSGIVALLTLHSPNMAFSWVRRGWVLWQLVRRIRRS